MEESNVTQNLEDLFNLGCTKVQHGIRANILIIHPNPKQNKNE